jgi:hypothetical protein
LVEVVGFEICEGLLVEVEVLSCAGGERNLGGVFGVCGAVHIFSVESHIEVSLKIGCVGLQDFEGQHKSSFWAESRCGEGRLQNTACFGGRGDVCLPDECPKIGEDESDDESDYNDGDHSTRKGSVLVISAIIEKAIV